MKRILGITILLLIFSAFFVSSVLAVGWVSALVIWAFAILSVALVAIALWLIENRD